MRYVVGTKGVFYLLAITLIAVGCDSGGGNEADSEAEQETGLPTAAFSARPTNITAGDTVAFTNESVDATSWEWEFGDGAASTEEHPTHIYADPGSYTVNLTARNSEGEDTETKEDFITVTDQPESPSAAFSADPTTVAVGEAVSFTDESSDATGWEWDFGDGATSTEQHPTHTYADSDTYTVSLTVANEAGSDTETKADYITVEPERVPPDAAFTASETTVFIADTISFTDESTNNPTSWEWDFGDETTSDQQNPMHAYGEDGIYTVRLTVSNDDGSDTATEVISVEPERRYSIKYEADATFVECDVNYDNESGGSTRRTINFAERDGPWTLSFDVTVGEFSSAFATLYLSCFEFEEEYTASAKLFIDGEVFEEGEETGSSVSISLGAHLTIDGAEPF